MNNVCSHAFIIGNTLRWILRLTLMEDNTGTGSEDSVIYTVLEIHFSMPKLCPAQSRPASNICGLIE